MFGKLMTTLQTYAHTSFWLHQLEETLQARSSLEGEQHADVAIIGAGFTGLWTAYYLKRHAPELEIVVLESEIAGFGASGRNGGWASAYLAGIEAMIRDPHRREGALRLQQHMIEQVPELGEVAHAEAIRCDFEQSGQLCAATSAAQLSRLRHHLAEMRGLGFDENRCRYLDAQELDTQIHIKGALGGFHFADCAAIQPAKLARGLADVLERKGVRIFERSPVQRLRPGVAETPLGRLGAERILLATEGYTQSITGLGRKLIPFHSMMVATEPLTDAQLECTGLKSRATFNNNRHLVTYGQLTADKRLAFGCRGRYCFGSGIIPSFQPSDPAFRIVEHELLEFFPGLDGVRFTHAWGGAMGVSRQLSPAVCFDEPAGLGWAGGYFGDGVTAASLAGRTLADLVLKRDTDRTRTPWVNPPGIRSLRRKRWEREPLRWMGIQARAQWMRWTDHAERHDQRISGLLNWSLEHVFP